MMLTKCPCCGHIFEADHFHAVRMSPVAFRILQSAPERFRRGTPMSTRDMAKLTGYSNAQVHAGYRELVRLGYLARIPYRKNASQYAGIPSVMLSDDLRALAA